MRSIYSLNIFFYGWAIRFASLFNSKAKLWVKGRKNIFVELEKKIKNDNRKTVWFHCASLGEFEQGRPLIEKIKTDFPDYKILLTFFSPSGYEVRKNYAGADIISYLPLDTKSNAKRFLDLVNPQLIYFVKYEFWLNFLFEFRKRKIHHFLISAIFRENQIFFRSYGKIFREALSGFTFIFTQEKKSVELLNSIQVSNCLVAGDTRFDRVAEIAEMAKEIPIAKLFSGAERKVIIAGSTWPTDEEKLFPILQKLFLTGWKLIIAPHELSGTHLNEIESGLIKSGCASAEIIRFSNADQENIFSAKILIIDNIGMLSSLYSYGRIAYVGGGFGRSIHNVLEPAVFGMPVIFGPRFEKFDEAKQLIETGAGVTVNNENDIGRILNKLTQDFEMLDVLSWKAKKFVQEKRGATKIILEKSNLFFSH